jgi:hypothetical protein
MRNILRLQGFSAIDWITFGAATISGDILSAQVTGDSYDGVFSQKSFDLDGSSVSVRVVEADPASSIDLMIVAGTPGGDGTPNAFLFNINGGVLTAKWQVNYQPIVLSQSVYDPVTHGYLQIASAAGTIRFSASPDGVRWRRFASCPASALSAGPVFIQLMGSVNSAPGTSVIIWQDFGASYATLPEAAGPPRSSPSPPSGQPPQPPAVVTGSGFIGTAPMPASLTAQGIKSVVWQGYVWEIEDWGTDGNGWPDASQVTIDSQGNMILSIGQLPDGRYCGAEVNSARGDKALANNPSTWGYGKYRWLLSLDRALAPDLVLGLFTYWARSKGGPPGQCEIDIEFSNRSTAGTTELIRVGYYANDDTDIQSAVPPCHVMVADAQLQMKAGARTVTVEFEWMPDHITYNVWYSTDTSGPPDDTVTIQEGQKYQFQEPYGGNMFAGTAHIPQTGGQQVIMNLWSHGQTVPAAQKVSLRSFTYTQPNQAV